MNVYASDALDDVREPMVAEWDRSRLSAFPFIHAAGDAAVDAFVRHGIYEEYTADCLVYDESDHGHSMYLMLSGRAMSWVDSIEAPAMTLGYHNSPSFFGELCFLCPGPRSASLTTCTDVELLRIDSADLGHLASACRGFVPALMRATVGRCRQNVGILKNAIFHTARERVVNTLWVIGSEHDTRTSGWLASPAAPRALRGTLAIHGYTHLDIAQMAVTSRETVSRTLADLEREGVILDRDSTSMTIDTPKLLALLRPEAALESRCAPVRRRSMGALRSKK